MQDPPQRFFAVDWSGARRGAERRIWLAEVRDGVLVRLESGRSREEVVELLVAEAADDSRLVVGLDFAFSFPAWYLAHVGCESVEAFWRLVGRDGPVWSEALEAPFFDRGSWHDDRNREFRDSSPYRRTERELTPRPETVFKLVGQRQVGKASLTGMPALLRLRDAGFSIWPFDAPELPVAVEIYPRLFYGPRVRKQDASSRRELVESWAMDSPHDLVAAAVASDDAFDAATSALGLYRQRSRLVELEREADPAYQLEGRIFAPQTQLALGLRGAAPATRRLAEALDLAVRLHTGRTRPSGAPWIAHLLGAAAKVLEWGGDEDEAVATFLQGALAAGPADEVAGVIGRRFGHRVASLVSGCSEALGEGDAPWRRGERELRRVLDGLSDSMAQIVLASSFDDCEVLAAGAAVEGDRMWRRMEARPEDVARHFRTLAGLLTARFEGRPGRLANGLARQSRRLAEVAGTLLPAG